MADSISDTISTTGRVTVGSPVEGEIETPNDRDAYAVELVAGRTYRIDLEGAATGKGTLVDPLLRWLRDSSGSGLHGTKDHDGGEGLNARQEFTPQVSGTYYISARGNGDGVGTYTLTVTDTTPVVTTNAAPTFGQVNYAFSLAENADGSTNRVSLGTVAATDPEGTTLAYNLVGDSGSFEIDEATGELFYTGSGEDHESGATSFSLTVRASDGSETADTSVAITVTDVNETPAFGQANYAFVLAENADGSSNRISLGTVAATDPEGTTLAYSLVGDSGSFEIDEATGELFYVGSGEDHESGTTSFSLTVRASDGSETTDTTVTVTVSNVNETPTFGQQGYTFSLAENADGTSNRISLGTVSATDPEGVSVGYSIVGGNESGSFEIDATTGELFYKGSGEDHESSATSFSLIVRASDGSETADTTVTINVTDVDEPVEVTEETGSTTDTDAARAGATDFGDITELQGPRFPLGTVDGDADQVDYYRFTLTEAKEVGLGLRQQDANADLFLEDADGNVLYRSTNSGTTNEAIAETLLAGTYYLRVESQEAGVNTHVVRYGVSAPDADALAELQQQSVTAVNAGPTFGQQGYTFSLAENADGSTDRVSLGTVAATDPEGTTLAYSLVGDSGSFEINETTGELFYTGSGEDYESDTTSYSLTVRASDGSETTDTTVTINVTDVEETADPPPADEDTSTPQTVSEPDDEDFSADTSTAGRVVVGETATGNIGSARNRDWFEVDLVAGREYQIDLRGSPTDDGTLSDPRLYGVHDADGNLIARTANDDGGEGYNSRVTFTATASGTHYIAAGAFGSNLGTYELEVTDKSPPAQQVVQQQVVQQAPVFGSQSYAFDLVENVDGSTDRVSLGTVSATDPEGTTLAYSLVGDSGSFEIDETSGELFYTGSGEDYESGTTSYSLTVRASDGSETTDATVTVTVTDVEETADPPAADEVDTSAPQTVSEPDGEDFSVDTSTAGKVVVGETATGEIGTASDRDWFAVELEAGKTYRINTDGVQSGGGTLPRGRLYGVYDADGTAIPGIDDEPITWRPIHYLSGQEVRNLDGLAFFTPDEDGTYYLEVGSGYFEVPFGGSVGTGTYSVGVAEMEDDFSASTDTTGTVEVGGTVTGESQYEIDRDWFAVELTAGETYKVELLGMRAKGGTLAQPYIWGIHDADGRLIPGTSDYASGPHLNSQVFVTPDADGTYYVAAGNHESGSLSEDLGTYLLQVSIDDFTDDIHTAGTLEVGGSVTGEIEAQGDRDWFAVTLEAGKTYQLDMEGSATGGGTLDNPTLYPLRDANGNVLHFLSRLGNDRDSGEGLNSRATFTVQEGGTYYVVALSGGHLHAADSHGRSIGTYTLSLQEVANPQQTATEPSDEDFSADTATAGRVVVGETATGNIGNQGDRDWFAVDLVAGREYQIDLRGSPTDDGTLSDPRLYGVHDAEGSRIAHTTNDDGGEGYNSRVTFTAVASGTHYIEAGAYGTNLGTYELEVTDKSPSFAQATYAFDVAENADGSTDRISLGTVSATDPEGGSLAYSLVGASSSFEIDVTSGELFYTGSGEDFESGTTRFEFTVRASDGSETADTTVTVNVTDVNESPESPDLYWTFIAENADGSTDRVSLGAVSATDPEGGSLAFSLVGASTSFEIDETTGELFYTGSGEDFESGTTRFEFTVRASDGSETADTHVAVLVTDVDEAPSFAQASHTFSLAENVDGSTDRVSLGTVSATDPEGTTLAYSLVGDSGSFEIDETSGELFYTGSGEDYESGTTSYSLTVRASDGSATTDATVTVTVTDVQEPAIRVADAEATEGDDSEIVFRVTLANASSGTVTVNYATADGTAVAGEDYTATSGTLTFAPGETEKTVAVTIIDDTVEDSGETFRLVLSDPSGAVLDDTEATGTILNADPVSEPDGEDLPNDITTTGVVAVDGSATGKMGSSDYRDWFAVELVAGTTYTIELKGSETNDGTLSNPYLWSIHDADGNRILGTSNDDGGQGLNSRLIFTATASETHYISAGAYSGVGTYTLAVTKNTDDFSPDTGTSGTVAVGGTATGEIDFPDDHDWFAVTLEAGKTYRFDLEGVWTDKGTLGNPYLRGLYDSSGTLINGTRDDSGGAYHNAQVYFKVTAGGTYYVAAGAAHGYDSGSYTLSVTETAADVAADTTTAATVAVGGTATGEIESPRDRDWYAVALEAGKTYRFDLEGDGNGASGKGTLTDPYLWGLHDATGALIDGTTDDDGGGGTHSRLSFTAATTGTYYVAAGAAYPADTGSYTLSVADITNDVPADTSTTATVAIGGVVTEDIEIIGDRDWFGVTLEAGKTYRFDLEGSYTNKGTLTNLNLWGLYDATGAEVDGTINGGGIGFNSHRYFTAAASGTYYVAAGPSHGPWVGSYTLAATELAADVAADTTTTATVAVDGTVTGDIESLGDRDWFAVSLEAGKTYRIDLEGTNTYKGTLEEPYLRGVFDSTGTLIDGTTDDDGGRINNSRVYLTASASGTYYVAASSAHDSYEPGQKNGGAAGTYTLSVTELAADVAADTTTAATVAVGGTATGEIESAGDRDWFAVTLEAGKTYQFDLEGYSADKGTLGNPHLRGIHDSSGVLIDGTTDSNSGRWNSSQVYFAVTTGGTYYVEASERNGSRTGTYSLTVTEIADDFFANTSTTATVVVGDTAEGEIEYSGDRDWFAVTLVAGKTYQFDLEGESTAKGTLGDPYLRGIHDATGTLIDGTTDDDGGDSLNSRVEFTAVASGTYYAAAGASGDLTGSYTLAAEEVMDSI